MLNVYHLQDVYLSILIEIYHYQLPTQTENSAAAVVFVTACKGSQQRSATWTAFATQIVGPCLHHKMSHGMGTMLVS